MGNDVNEIIKDMQFGPKEVKLEALGKIIEYGGSIETYGTVLDKIISSESHGTALHFFSIAALVKLGERSHESLAGLLCYLDSDLSFESGQGGYIPIKWIPYDVTRLGFELDYDLFRTAGLLGNASLATLILLCEVCQKNGASSVEYKLISRLLTERLEQGPGERIWRTLLIYALGVIGSQDSIAIIQYYSDRNKTSQESKAACTVLENYGKKDFTEFIENHCKLDSARPLIVSESNSSSPKSKKAKVLGWISGVVCFVILSTIPSKSLILNTIFFASSIAIGFYVANCINKKTVVS